MGNNKCLYITGIIILFFCLQTNAQNDLFNVGAILGLNIASLPNDENDYNGINTGIFCDANINKHFDVKIEMLYSQNGEYILPKYYPNIDYGKIRLSHIEIPLHFDFYINSYESTNFFPDWTLELGLAYARLFRYYAEDVDGNNITDQVVYDYYNTILLQWGTTLFFSKHIGGNLRFSKPLSNKGLDITGALRLIYRL